MIRHMTKRSTPITWFVSRHPGAIAWAKEQNLAIDRWVAHLAPGEIAPGDTVIGTLPVHLAAEVCARGGRYVHLTLDIPEAQRGRELSAEDLHSFRATLCAYRIFPEESVS